MVLKGNTDRHRIFYANKFTTPGTVNNNTRETSLCQHSDSRMFSTAVQTYSFTS